MYLLLTETDSRTSNKTCHVLLFVFSTKRLDLMQGPTTQWKIVIVHAFNPFPNKPLFLLNCGTSLLKTPWEKEKLL